MIADRSIEPSRIEHFLVCAEAFFEPQVKKIGITLRAYAEKLSEKATIAYTTKDNGELIGMVAGYTHDTADNTSYITQVYVLPEYRGQGLSTILLQEYVEYCKNNGLKGVWLTTRKNNDTAQRAYEKAGFALAAYDSQILVKYMISF